MTRSLYQVFSYNSPYTWNEALNLLYNSPFAASGSLYPNIPGTNPYADKFNTNILYLAIKSQNASLVKKVLGTEENIEINEQDSLGWTPLHLAAYHGDPEIVKELLSRNAVTTIKNKTGLINNNPIELAANNFNLEATKAFIEAGYKLPEITSCVVSNAHKAFLEKVEDYLQTPPEQNSDIEICSEGESNNPTEETE